MLNRRNGRCRYTQRQQQQADGRYVCMGCGYEYDPEKGDPEAGIEPGTSFEALPEDWICPECGVSKSEMISAVTRG